MAKIVLAVSGGVDSIVMLDLTCRSKKFRQEDLIVAHFDHGIRANSAEDANFVEQRAKEYGLDFFMEAQNYHSTHRKLKRERQDMIFFGTWRVELGRRKFGQHITLMI